MRMSTEASAATAVEVSETALKRRLEILMPCSDTEWIMNIKRHDQSIALEIAGFAGMPTRDARGNLLSSLWSKHFDNSDVGLLIERNDIRVLLLKQIEAQIREQKNSINLLEENDVVCRWILDFTNSWERVYTEKKQQNFDIAQTVLSAMNEAYFSVESFLEEYSALKPSVLRQRLDTFLGQYKNDALARRYAAYLAEANRTEPVQSSQSSQSSQNPRPLKRPNENGRKNNFANSRNAVEPYDPHHPKQFLHALDNAVIRFLFRNPYFGMHMRRVAGKLLKKQEVCNKPGAYSAKIQRNDITQEVNEALDQFCRVLQEDVMQKCAQALNDDKFLLQMCFDHRGLPMFDDMLITTV
jgi:hypothetical protein